MIRLLAALAALTTLETPPRDLVAVGIIWSAQPGCAAAVLRSGQRTRIVGVGDAAFGGRVTAISASSVSVEFGSQILDVHIQGEAAATPRTQAPPPPRPVDAVPDALPPPVTRTLERQEVERRLADEVPRILAETTLSPVSDAGGVVGFALTRIPEGSLLTDAGLRPGDILTQINDVPIDSMATLVGLWPRLRAESELRAVVLRGGRPVSLVVSLH
jgi:type II secretory pathway component PulC